MQKLLPVLNISKRIALAFLILISIYFAGVFALPHIQYKSQQAKSGGYTCYLKTNGSHVDLIMPIKTENYDWSAHLDLKDIEASDSSYQWIAFGWGDKNFYLNTPNWSDLKFSTAFNAAFGLSSGAIHVTYYDTIQKGKNCKPFVLNSYQMIKLFEFVYSDFDNSESRLFSAIKTDMNYGPRDAFYDSKKSYSLFHTCNTWINDALEHSEYDHCLWTAMDFGVMNLLDSE